jgi:hypothetical protein
MKMGRKQFLFLLAVIFTVLSTGVRPARAVPVDLFGVLGNAGFENDLVHSQWTVTQPNSSYQSTVPVNPTILPLDPCCSNGTTLPALTAPVGNNFIGVLNPTLNEDRKGKLAHDAVANSYASGTTFEILVWGNRGRLGSNGNTNSTFPGAAPALIVQFMGWGAGSVPTVNSSDDWSRVRLVNVSLPFTNWGSPGQWTSQEFLFTTPVDLAYISLALSLQNVNHDQYVASDTAPIPEPGSLVLLIVGGLLLIGHGRLSRRTASLALARRSPNLSR